MSTDTPEPFESLKRRAWETFRERWEEFKPRRLQILEELRRRAGGDVEDAVLVEQSWRDCVAEFERPSEPESLPASENFEDVESLEQVQSLHRRISRKRKQVDLKDAVGWAFEQMGVYRRFLQLGKDGESGARAIRESAPSGEALSALELAVSNQSSFMQLLHKTVGQKDEAAEERDRVLAEDARDQFAVIDVLEAEFAK